MHHSSDSFESSTQKHKRNPNNRGGFLSLKPPFKFRIFKCKRCTKTFPTSQALGGHQNAHRDEISKERRQHTKIPDKKRAKLELVKPQNGVFNIEFPASTLVAANPKPAGDLPLGLKLTLGPGSCFEYKKKKASTNLRVGSINNDLPSEFRLTIGNGSYCRCMGKEAGPSDRVRHVARFRSRPKPEVSVVDLDLLELNTPKGQKEDDNAQPLDLTLKL